MWRIASTQTQCRSHGRHTYALPGISEFPSFLCLPCCDSYQAQLQTLVTIALMQLLPERKWQLKSGWTIPASRVNETQGNVWLEDSSFVSGVKLHLSGANATCKDALQISEMLLKPRRHKLGHDGKRSLNNHMHAWASMADACNLRNALPPAPLGKISASILHVSQCPEPKLQHGRQALLEGRATAKPKGLEKRFDAMDTFTIHIQVGMHFLLLTDCCRVECMSQSIRSVHGSCDDWLWVWVIAKWGRISNAVQGS